MKTRIRTFDFFADGGHGWLRVKRVELEQLNILNDISVYSYQNDKYVFLEEDCDASIFIAAIEEHGAKVKFNNHYSEGDSPIRNYDHFRLEV